MKNEKLKQAYEKEETSTLYVMLQQLRDDLGKTMSIEMLRKHCRVIRDILTGRR